LFFFALVSFESSNRLVNGGKTNEDNNPKLLAMMVMRYSTVCLVFVDSWTMCGCSSMLRRMRRNSISARWDWEIKFHWSV